MDIITNYRNHLRPMAKSTQAVYTGEFKRFVAFFKGEDYRYISHDKIVEYLAYLYDAGFSPSKVNQAINAIKFYKEKVLGQKSSIQYPVSSIQYPVSSIQYPVSGIQYQVSSIMNPVSCIKQPSCSRCGATHGTTIQRLRDIIYCEVSDREFENFVAYIRKNNVTGEQACAKFGYELVQVTTTGKKAFCQHCGKIAAANALKNRKNLKPDNTNVGKLF